MSLDESAAASGPSPPVVGFEDPSVEAEYQFARRKFLQPSPAHGKLIFLLVSLAAFTVTRLADGGSIERLAILVAVLLFHELGHYVGMLTLGYRDVRMFFIPFFGAAVSGKKGTASQTSEAVVLLLGPVPGIILGLFVAIAALVTRAPLLLTIANYLLLLNAANLLPVAPLDGGQFFLVLLFSRWGWLERLFLWCAGAALVGWAIYSQLFYMSIFGLLFLVGLPIRNRMNRAAAALRPRLPSLVNDPQALDEESTRRIFLAVRETLPSNARKPQAIAQWMGQVLERLSLRPPSAGTSLALVAAWAVALVLAFAGLVVAAGAAHRIH
jgi:Zn-dependent protease